MMIKQLNGVVNIFYLAIVWSLLLEMKTIYYLIATPYSLCYTG